MFSKTRIEAATRGVLKKNVFLEISQNSQGVNVPGKMSQGLFFNKVEN